MSDHSMAVHREHFATTRWSMVVAAGQQRQPHARHALEELCAMYWYPLYAYVRRSGFSREDAEDHTQAFFAGLLESNPFAALHADKGKFRSFLLICLKHYLSNARDHRATLKRGGGLVHLPLDWQSADSQFMLVSQTDINPEVAFDREWATTLLDRVLERLQSESEAAGKGEVFQALKLSLSAGKGSVDYAAAALQLRMSEGAVRVTVHRLRGRYRELLKEEIGQTLTDPSQVEDELKALFNAFSR